MLSLFNVGGSRDAGKYYEQADDYYTKDHSPSSWKGKGAEILGLKGEVQIEDFKKLLDGVLPNEQVIKLSPQGRRGGTDLTFSAPKSVSMQALIGGDLRLIEAHERAVQRTLDYAESLIAYRLTEKGETKRIFSQNLISATFRHELSRACDPQLHSHSVVLNMTQRKDGKWRAIDNNLIYQQKMLMGVMYRAELTREVQKLGYGIRRISPDGCFELAHMTEQQIDLFSQRSKIIEEILKQNGKTREEATPQEKQIIAIATRPNKTEVDRQALKEYWQEKSREAQINYKISKSSFFSKFIFKKNSEATSSVNFAVNHLLERQSVITEAQIIKEALQIGVGKTIYDEIKAELKVQVKSGTLLQSEDRYTTPEAIEREKNILRMEKEGRGIVKPIIKKEPFYSFLDHKGLNQGQKEAAGLILTSKNQIVGVQGLAGTGKTFMLSTARELAEREGYQLIGLTPSASAAQELSKTGITSQTIASFQSDKHKSLTQKSILIIDEAGMVSTKQMESLLKTGAKHRSRIVLIGDTQQLKAVEAGRPFDQLQRHGMKTAKMSEIQRQKNPELKKAVELASIGEIKESVALLQKSIQEIKKPEERYAQIAKDYTNLPEQERKETLIVSGTNEARKAINEEVRNRLKLTGTGISTNILENKDLTKTQIKDIENYKIGDYVKSEKNYRSLRLRTGDLCKVIQINKEKESIFLQKENGGVVEWKPKKKNKFNVYNLQKRELAKGDLIRITQNDREKNLINGDKASILKIENKNRITLQKEDGTVFQLDPSKPLPLEHGYCSTVHSSQGKTCNRVFIEGNTRSLTSTQDTYYVAISRAQHESRIYTDNQEKLPKAMGRENIKEAGLDLSRKSEGQKFLKTNFKMSKIKQTEKDIELEKF